jgi:hypothetical protein
MNEREEFLQYFQSILARMVEKIETMTESQALDGLREVKAARNIYDEELAERIQTMTDTEVPEGPREVRPRETSVAWSWPFSMLLTLRSHLSSTARYGSPPSLLDTIEDALNKRLETLRREGK